MSGTPKTIILQPGDACLVMKPNFVSELHRYCDNPDDPAPINAIMITAIALRIAHDAEWCQQQLDWLAEQRDQAAKLARA